MTFTSCQNAACSNELFSLTGRLCFGRKRFDWANVNYCPLFYTERSWHILIFYLFWNVKLFILWLIEGFRLFNPFSPNIDPQANSPNSSLYISLNNKLREFEKRSKYFLFGDHFINSHNLTSWHCMNIIKRKLMLVT